jgi:WD40 repeat protein
MLPSETVCHVLSYLSGEDLVKCRLLCSDLKNSVEMEIQRRVQGFPAFTLRQQLHLCVKRHIGFRHSDVVYYAQFSPDGTNIVSASEDDTVRVWSVATGDCVQALEGHSKRVWSAQFSPDGTNIVSASGDQTVRVWSVATGECVQTLEGHSHTVSSAQFSPDGTKIVSASWDKTVRVWKLL